RRRAGAAARPAEEPGLGPGPRAGDGPVHSRGPGLQALRPHQQRSQQPGPDGRSRAPGRRRPEPRRGGAADPALPGVHVPLPADLEHCQPQFGRLAAAVPPTRLGARYATPSERFADLPARPAAPGRLPGTDP
ncbi:Uncharacterized protein APZ42_002674, partial [Daphnia magna]